MATPSTATSTPLSPSQADTFASSQGDLNLTNFSEHFSTIEKENHAENLPVAKGGAVEGHNIHVLINVTDEPPSVSTSALSQVFGDSKDNSGIAKTQATIVINFDVAAGKVFSFEFSATLDIQTRIRELKVENAHASGDVSFRLFDTSDIPKQNLKNFLSSLLSQDTNTSIKKSPLDFFSFAENLNSFGNNDSDSYQKSQNVTVFNGDKKFVVGGTQEFAKHSVKGSFKRSFAKATNLTLIALRRSEAKVTASNQVNA